MMSKQTGPVRQHTVFEIPLEGDNDGNPVWIKIEVKGNPVAAVVGVFSLQNNHEFKELAKHTVSAEHMPQPVWNGLYNIANGDLTNAKTTIQSFYDSCLKDRFSGHFRVLDLSIRP